MNRKINFDTLSNTSNESEFESPNLVFNFLGAKHNSSAVNTFVNADKERPGEDFNK